MNRTKRLISLLVVIILVWLIVPSDMFQPADHNMTEEVAVQKASPVITSIAPHKQESVPVEIETTESSQPEIPQDPVIRGVYLGVQGYNTIDALYKDSFGHRFNIGGREVVYQVSNRDDYRLHNLLAEGYVFDLTLEGEMVIELSPSLPEATGSIIRFDREKIELSDRTIALTNETSIYRITPQAGGAVVTQSELQIGDPLIVFNDPADTVYLRFRAQPYIAPVKGQPGLRTVKNLLQTALEPVGTTLYIYGGAWNWQDDGSSLPARTIGLDPKMVDFFQSQNENYSYIDQALPTASFFPHSRYNQYYCAGMDCSGYVGWVLYNTFNRESGGDGYVEQAETMAETFSRIYDYGSRTRAIDRYQFLPGDIFSMSGHVWMCLGVCQDGSIVILHSTPSPSYVGFAGGGVQLSALGENIHAEAYRLADEYNRKYYPDWSSRYPTLLASYDSYTEMQGPVTGKFSWHQDQTGLLDPDGYRDMSADDILADLFARPLE